MATSTTILDGTILASGKGWQIVKPSKGRLQLHWLCLNCHHRIGRHNLGWHHFYQDGPNARRNRRSVCGCGCRIYLVPKPKAIHQAYIKFEHCELKIQKERLNGRK